MDNEYKSKTSKKFKNGILATVCAINMVGVPVVTTIQADTITQEVVTESEIPNLELRIEDSEGNSIGGTFGIYTDSECITKIQESAATNGVISFNKTLEKNKTYYIKQLTADSEYEADSEIHSFTLNTVSPAEEKITFSYDGKTYGIGDSDIYRVDGDWGSMKISVLITNDKKASTSSDLFTNNSSNGTNSTAYGTDTSKTGTTKSDGSKTGVHTNFNSFGILAGLSTLGVISLVAYKHKKEGGVSE